MKSVLVLLAALCLTTPAAAQQPLNAITVEVASGYNVILSGVGIESRDGGAADLRGWAQRQRGRIGLVRAHLHVQAFDASGAQILLVEDRWQGALSIRDRAAAPFRVMIDAPIAAQAERFRVSVAPDDHA